MSKTRQNFARAARRIERYGRAVGRAEVSGLRQIGEEIITDVKAARPRHGVPVDTGVLRSTGRAEGPRPDKTVLLGFGGPAAEYALVQHERLDYHHDIGEARYLVRGVDRWRPAGAASTAARKAQVRLVGQGIGQGL